MRGSPSSFFAETESRSGGGNESASAWEEEEEEEEDGWSVELRPTEGRRRGSAQPHRPPLLLLLSLH